MVSLWTALRGPEHKSSSGGGGAAAAAGPSGIAAPDSGCLLKGYRGKLLALLTILILAVILLLLQCLHPLLLRSSLCCRGQGGEVLAEGPLLAGGSLDDYEYDDGAEGSQHIRYHHTKRRLPHAIIIGVRKGGTRALLEFLNLHPSIQAEKKEMHFFDNDDTYSKGIDWYRKRMPFSFEDQLTIEKTPAYFTSEQVPERVYQMNNSIRLLLVVRDPVERAISDYTQIHSNKLEKGRQHEPFESLVLDEDGEVRRSYAAVRRSIYHRHIERWLQFFPLKQFHLVSSERLVTHPVQELRLVERFLGLEHRLDDNFFYFNSTKGFYCLRKPEYAGGRKNKCLAKSKGRMHPFIDPVVISKLRKFFAPHNQRFFELIDNHRDFNWPET